MFYLDETIYIDSRKETAIERLGCHLASLLTGHFVPPIFLCIGSDKVRGDSLGPLIGSLLLQNRKDLCVLGTMDFPVHALNLSAAADHINRYFPDQPVVAIDASLGTREHLNFLTLGKGSLRPGAGVRKTLGSFGDIFLTGIVAPAGPFSHLALQMVQHSTVMAMANVMAEGILTSLEILPANTKSRRGM